MRLNQHVLHNCGEELKDSLVLEIKKTAPPAWLRDETVLMTSSHPMRFRVPKICSRHIAAFLSAGIFLLKKDGVSKISEAIWCVF